jgi:ribA/ribD-fused uncharacterized protein
MWESALKVRAKLRMRRKKKLESQFASIARNLNSVNLAALYVEPFKLEDPRSLKVYPKLWATVEHYFQAAKFPTDPAYREKIRTAPTPEKAKLLGGNRAKVIDPKWDSKREDVMRKALYCKALSK